MRNLAQYPLTHEETKQILLRLLAKARETAAPGDMEAYALRKVSEFIENHAADFDKSCVMELADTH